MKEVFVDTNIFLRFFTRDDEGQHRRAVQLLKSAAAGKVSLVTGPPVMFEVAWALASAYEQPRDRVLDALEAIAATPGLRLLDAKVVGQAIALARRTGTDFADSYIAASAAISGAAGIATFNRRHFERLGVTLAEF